MRIYFFNILISFKFMLNFLFLGFCSLLCSLFYLSCVILLFLFSYIILSSSYASSPFCSCKDSLSCCFFFLLIFFYFSPYFVHIYLFLLIILPSSFSILTTTSSLANILSLFPIVSFYFYQLLYVFLSLFYIQMFWMSVPVILSIMSM